MRTLPRILTTAGTVLALSGSLTLLPAPTLAADEQAVSVLDQGREISFDRKKGNCLACHQIEGGSLPGNIGPPLIVVKRWFITSLGST